ncbi:MAG: hypothetical protein LQ348_000411 [Seirophora lacunosa]|nr:MAG: hypothetical protein LQ348_000411 [Seirophora lacunosa]
MTFLAKASEPLFLFGRPWLPPPWHASDDRVRGGFSRSSLSALPYNCAVFDGHLDIKALGGAGFASQLQSATPDPNDERTTTGGATWDLSPYDGLEIDVRAGDGKIYTLLLKDETSGDKRDDGRERAGINWEAEFQLRKSGENVDGQEGGGQIVWVPWSALRPTYRGKEKKDAGKLKLGEIKRLGFMMRRYVYPQVAISDMLTVHAQLFRHAARRFPSGTQICMCKDYTVKVIET